MSLYTKKTIMCHTMHLKWVKTVQHLPYIGVWFRVGWCERPNVDEVSVRDTGRRKEPLSTVAHWSGTVTWPPGHYHYQFDSLSAIMPSVLFYASKWLDVFFCKSSCKLLTNVRSSLNSTMLEIITGLKFNKYFTLLSFYNKKATWYIRICTFALSLTVEAWSIAIYIFSVSLTEVQSIFSVSVIVYCMEQIIE